MKTIDERAEEKGKKYGSYFPAYIGDIPERPETIEFWYSEGAYEQKAIDIVKACVWIKENHLHYFDPEKMASDFRKAMLNDWTTN